MKKYKVLVAFILVLTTTDSYASKKDKIAKQYLEGIDIAEVKITYKHETHGQKSLSEEPLATTNKECTEKAYAGKSIKLGKSIVVSDPDIMFQLSLDYTNYYLLKSMGVNERYEKGRRSYLWS